MSGNYGARQPNNTAYIKRFFYGEMGELWKTILYTPSGGNPTQVLTPSSQTFDSLYITGNLYVDGNVNWKVGGDFNLTVGGAFNASVGSKTETIKGQSNIRYNGDLHQWIGGNFYNRKQSGQTDFSCPADTRTGGTDCSDVNSASEVE